MELAIEFVDGFFAWLDLNFIEMRLSFCSICGQTVIYLGILSVAYEFSFRPLAIWRMK